MFSTPASHSPLVLFFFHFEIMIKDAFGSSLAEKEREKETVKTERVKETVTETETEIETETAIETQIETEIETKIHTHHSGIKLECALGSSCLGA